MRNPQISKLSVASEDAAKDVTALETKVLLFDKMKACATQRPPMLYDEAADACLKGDVALRASQGGDLVAHTHPPPSLCNSARTHTRPLARTALTATTTDPSSARATHSRPVAFRAGACRLINRLCAARCGRVRA